MYLYIFHLYIVAINREGQPHLTCFCVSSVCVYCISACLVRNLGMEAYQAIADCDDWDCLLCNPPPQLTVHIYVSMDVVYKCTQTFSGEDMTIVSRVLTHYTVDPEM